MNNIKWHEVTWYSKWGAIILFLLVVPVLAFIIGTKYQEVKQIERDLINNPVATITPKEDLGSVTFISKTSTSTKSNIEFKVVLAELSFPKDKTIEEKINKTIEQNIKEVVQTYQANVGDLPCTNNTGNGCKSSVDVVATTTISKRFHSVSVEIDVFVASESMAHPDYQRERTFHFDLKNGEQKTYYEILGREKIDILNKLSMICREKLSAILHINQNSAGADTFEKGTAPLEENYQHVLVGQDGVIVSFGEYQVGARPLGAPQVSISYKEMQ